MKKKEKETEKVLFRPMSLVNVFLYCEAEGHWHETGGGLTVASNY